MARVKLEFFTWPIARLEAKIDNILKDPKKHKLSQPIDFNPWAKKPARKKDTVGTISGKELAEMVFGPRKVKAEK